MPLLTYFVVAGTALLALLFYADAHMERRGPLAISSQFAGLPKPRAAVQDPFHSLAAAPAPAPDMQSAAVLAAAPPPDPNAKSAAAPEPARQTAKAEPAPRKKRHVARRPPPPHEPRFAWRGSDGGPFGLPFFGRF
jgi:hypothetical protein